jgi:hypothetical protein
MENKQAHILSELFEWIEHKPFSALDERQQNEVLQNVPEQEYNELHQAATAIRSTREAGSTMRNMPVKQSLLQKFDSHHKPAFSLFPYMNILWKIAAVFLLFASGWLCHYLAGYRPNASPMAVADTVYITEQGEPVKIFDTIYLEEPRSAAKEVSSPILSQDKMREKRDATNRVHEHINLIPARSIDSPPVPRRDGHRDDSLLKPGNS